MSQDPPQPAPGGPSDPRRGIRDANAPGAVDVLRALVLAIEEYERAPFAHCGARQADVVRLYRLARAILALPEFIPSGQPLEPFGQYRPGIEHDITLENDIPARVWRQDLPGQRGRVEVWLRGADRTVSLPEFVTRAEHVRALMAFRRAAFDDGSNAGRARLRAEIATLLATINAVGAQP